MGLAPTLPCRPKRRWPEKLPDDLMRQQDQTHKALWEVKVLVFEGPFRSGQSWDFLGEKEHRKQNTKTSRRLHAVSGNAIILDVVEVSRPPLHRAPAEEAPGLGLCHSPAPRGTALCSKAASSAATGAGGRCLAAQVAASWIGGPVSTWCACEPRIAPAFKVTDAASSSHLHVGAGFFCSVICLCFASTPV